MSMNGKLYALHGGGDWADASAEYIVIPDCIDLSAQRSLYRDWYNNEYCRTLRSGGKAEYMTFKDWLILAGATEATENEIVIIDDN